MVTDFKTKINLQDLLQIILVRMTIQGKSLWPFIDNGSHVIVQQVDINDIKTGDIIIYKVNKLTLVCHIVVKHNKNYLTTKGLLSVYFDPKVAIDDVLGRVKAIELQNGYILDIDNNIFMHLNHMIAMYSLTILRVYRLLIPILGNLFFFKQIYIAIMAVPLRMAMFLLKNIYREKLKYQCFNLYPS